MKNKNIRRLLCGIMICCSLAVMGASAATTTFTLTVTQSGAGQDISSKRALKNTDGAKYFVVTPTSYSPSNGGLHVTSKQLNGSAKSEKKYLQGGTGSSRYGYYTNNFAPGNVYYYLEASKSSFVSGYTSQNVQGRYTP